MYGEDDEAIPNSSHVAKILARRPDKVTLETCVSVSALALACVMAGTGDLESLKLIRSLYFKVRGAHFFTARFLFLSTL